mmetsp:Transcript_28802/g.47719  ORF Transcript_28802/g.47719 Transcript_28802/m.47719 type:complete len:216 (-) Transcript_28802:34-681(-)
MRSQFERYSTLPINLGHVIEIGCGPFTQLQTILQSNVRAESLTLVDPLLAHYRLHVKGCTFKHGKLLGQPARLVAKSVEELQVEARVDTLVMISVLQSVRDVPRVLQAAYNLLRAGGLLVFADRVFDAQWDTFKKTRDPFWDVGHPCSVKQLVVDLFLAKFDEMYSHRWVKSSSLHAHPSLREKHRAHSISQHTRAPDEQVYFIGRKLRTKGLER